MMSMRASSKAGFTLIEVVLAVVVISILIAIILPRAQRANVDAKYTGVRQAAAEIGRWGMEWGTRNLEAQSPDATCNLNDYIGTLLGYVGDVNGPNWVQVNQALDTGCRGDTGTGGITYAVGDLIPRESQPRNPFNGLSYFNVQGGNDGNRRQAGLLYLSFYDEPAGGVRNYYFVYTGTDSDTADQWHAGMGSGSNPGEAQLRNGVFMARQAP
jgi:prepilin-type N-terminal cleavage/methylation domain-containing protein